MNKWLIANHRVRSYELDSFGHVNNAVFLNYLEFARNEFLLQKGLRFQDFHRWDALPLVVKVEMIYKSPAAAHEMLEIRGRLSKLKMSSFVMEYEIHNKTKQLVAATSTMAFVFVNKRGKPVPIPQEFKEKMTEE